VAAFLVEDVEVVWAVGADQNPVVDQEGEEVLQQVFHFVIPVLSENLLDSARLLQPLERLVTVQHRRIHITADVAEDVADLAQNFGTGEAVQGVVVRGPGGSDMDVRWYRLFAHDHTPCLDDIIN